jgi:AraC-like DNA-binding protein
MDHLDRLLATVDRIALLDSFQYVAATRQPVPLPSDIRIIVRKRRAAALGRAVHDQSILVVALRGHGLVEIDRCQVLLRAGEALLIPPGTVHGYADAVDADVHWLFCGFHHPDPGAWESLRATPVRMPARLADDLAGLLADHFLDTAHGKRRTPHSQRLVALRLLLALEELRAAHAAASGGLEGGARRVAPDANHAFVQRVVAHVGEHLAGRLSTAAIARALRMSPGHLRNQFHRLTGGSLGRYIRAARIRQACILLDTTDLPLAGIGNRCGYDSIFSFSRAFKADKGIPPTAYRKTLRPVR